MAPPHDAPTRNVATRRPGGVPRRPLVAVLLAGGILLAGCGESEPGTGPSGPPISGVVAPSQLTVEWAGGLCTVLDPVFDALRLPATDGVGPVLPPHLDQVRAAAAALREADSRLHAVGAAPADEGQVIIDRVADRLGRLAADLEAAAHLLRTADRGEPAEVARAVAAARAVLQSFDRAALGPLLDADPAVRNALVFAPACSRS